jgi:polyphosphate kinase
VAEKTEQTKEEKIKKEISRLKKNFRSLDGNKLRIVSSLIERAAFLSVSLSELEEIINTTGYTEEYQNGENQNGVKQSESVKIHISMTKNLATIIGQLARLCPPEERKESKLLALMRGE